jgi:hypothetical protein
MASIVDVVAVDSCEARELNGDNEGRIHGAGIVEEGAYSSLGMGNVLGCGGDLGAGYTGRVVVGTPPSSHPDRALSTLTYGLKPSCNLSQSRYGRTTIACAHITGDSNAHLSQVSYRNLLTAQYKQGCNQCEHFHTQVYHKINTHQLHLNAPYKHLSTSVPTSPVEHTN